MRKDFTPPSNTKTRPSSAPAAPFPWLDALMTATQNGNGARPRPSPPAPPVVTPHPLNLYKQVNGITVMQRKRDIDSATAARVAAENQARAARSVQSPKPDSAPALSRVAYSTTADALNNEPLSERVNRHAVRPVGSPVGRLAGVQSVTLPTSPPKADAGAGRGQTTELEDAIAMAFGPPPGETEMNKFIWHGPDANGPIAASKAVPFEKRTATDHTNVAMAFVPDLMVGALHFPIDLAIKTPGIVNGLVNVPRLATGITAPYFLPNHPDATAPLIRDPDSPEYRASVEELKNIGAGLPIGSYAQRFVGAGAATLFTQNPTLAGVPDTTENRESLATAFLPDLDAGQKESLWNDYQDEWRHYPERPLGRDVVPLVLEAWGRETGLKQAQEGIGKLGTSVSKGVETARRIGTEVEISRNAAKGRIPIYYADGRIATFTPAPRKVTPTGTRFKAPSPELNALVETHAQASPLPSSARQSAVRSVYEARARRWSQATGKNPAEFYQGAKEILSRWLPQKAKPTSPDALTPKQPSLDITGTDRLIRSSNTGKNSGPTTPSTPSPSVSASGTPPPSTQTGTPSTWQIPNRFQTVGQAEAWLRQQKPDIQVVDFDRNVRIANIVCDALDQIYTQGIDYPEGVLVSDNWFKDPARKDAPAAAVNAFLGLNPRHPYWQDPAGYVSKLNQPDRIWSTDHPLHPIFHEAGHLELFRREDNAVVDHYQLKPHTSHTYNTAKSVSGYAATSVGEFLSECLAVLLSGGTLSPAARKIYNRNKGIIP